MPEPHDSSIFEDDSRPRLSYVAAPQTSLAAILSLVLGLVSPFLACACFTWIPAAIAAIVTGHVARYEIRHSAGRLRGMSLALAGILLGYVTLTGGSAIFVWIATRPNPAPSPPAAAPADEPDGTPTLGDAEERISVAAGEFALGNSTEAALLANQFATLMRTLESAAFASIAGRQSIVGTKCYVWCELRPKKCAFIVQIEGYDDASDDTQLALEQAAWIAAQKAVDNSSQKLLLLGVGLKGEAEFGSVTIGKVAPTLRGNENVISRGTDRQLLELFFIKDPPELSN